MAQIRLVLFGLCGDRSDHRQRQRIASSNGSEGIDVTDGVVLGNVASGNGGAGSKGDVETGYGINVFNNDGGAEAVGGPTGAALLLGALGVFTLTRREQSRHQGR